MCKLAVMDAKEFLKSKADVSCFTDGELESFPELMEAYHQLKSKEYIKSPTRDIISDVMDEFASAAMLGGSVNVSEFVDELHNKLLAKSKEEAEERLVGYVDYMIALTKYIELMGVELDETAVLAYTHGWRSGRVELGKEMRAELNKMAKGLLLPEPFGKEK
jgi:hypothetical protein